MTVLRQAVWGAVFCAAHPRSGLDRLVQFREINVLQFFVQPFVHFPRFWPIPSPLSGLFVRFLFRNRDERFREFREPLER